MDERNLYRELVAWLRSDHPLVLAQWEREQRRRGSRKGSDKLYPQGLPARSRSGLDRLSPEASIAEVISAVQSELESLGISGGTPGTTSEGTPCIHLIKKGVYGRTYEESVTVARLRDTGYRRHLKQVFG